MIASLITLLVGVFACAVHLIIEEEQQDMELSLLRHSLSMLCDSRERKSDDAQMLLLQNADISNGKEKKHSSASQMII